MLILGLGLVTSAVMSFAEGELQGNILITLSLSSLIIYAPDALKKSIFRRERGKIVCFSFALLTALALAVGVCCFSGVEIDYGIMGVLLPVTVRLPDFGSFGAKAALASIYTPVTVFLLFSAGLIALSLVLGGGHFVRRRILSDEKTRPIASRPLRAESILNHMVMTRRSNYSPAFFRKRKRRSGFRRDFAEMIP